MLFLRMIYVNIIASIGEVALTQLAPFEIVNPPIRPRCYPNQYLLRHLLTLE